MTDWLNVDRVRLYRADMSADRQADAKIKAWTMELVPARGTAKGDATQAATNPQPRSRLNPDEDPPAAKTCTC